MATDIAISMSSEKSIIFHDVTLKLLLIMIFSKNNKIYWLNTSLGCKYGGYSRNKEILFIHHGTSTELEYFLKSSRRFYKIFTVSLFWKNFLEKELKRVVFVFPLTVNTSVFQAKELNDANLEFIKIGFVGKALANRDDRKGINLLLNVCRGLSKFIKFKLIVVGSDWSDLLKNHFEGVDYEIFEIDDYKKSSNLYSIMDILLITSNVEGGPITLLEAMASGTPVISTNVGHVSEIVNGKNSIVIDHGVDTTNDFIKAILFLSENKDIRRQMSLNARNFIVEKRSHLVLTKIFDFRQFD